MAGWTVVPNMDTSAWKVVKGAGRPAGLPDGVDLPQLDAHPSVNMDVASTPASRLLGSGHPLDAAGVVGSHLKNLVAGPYHAFTDAPGNAEEAAENGAMGKIGLGASRMFVNPTRDALSALPSSKNATDVMNHLTDAIPVVGPWARSIENEAQEKGALPALLGAGVDAFAPDVVGGALGKIRGAAPSMAEGALNIRRGDRGFGKTPGRAILDETTGFRPETVGSQAQSVLDTLTPQLEEAAAKRSVRPNSIRGLLPAPAEEIPLHSSPDVTGNPSRTVTIYQPDRGTPLGLPIPSDNIPLSSHSDIFPDQLPSATSSVRPKLNNSDASGLGPGEYLGQIPGDRGGSGQAQGVLRRPFVSSDSTPLPRFEPNPIASLAPARDILNSAVSKATLQNAEGLRNQLGSMNDFLNTRLATGNSIPENITPSDLLNLKRGFSEEHLRWNPDIRNGALSSGRQAYRALDSELDRTVPEAADINQRISSLIPVTKAAEKLSRADELPQKFGDKLKSHTGALTSAVAGAAGGAHFGGGLGGALGGIAGFALPEVVASPTSRMALARLMNSRIPSSTLQPLLTGGIVAPKKRTK